MKILMAEFTEIESDRRIIKEIDTLERAGHEITVIGVTHKEKKTVRKKLGRKSFLVSLPYRNIKPGSVFSRLIRFFDQVIVTFHLWLLVMLQRDIDVFHSHNPFTLPAMAVKSKLSRKPLIYDTHEVWWELKAQLIDPAACFEKVFIKWAKCVITTSEKFDPFLIEKYKLECPVVPLPNYPALSELVGRSDENAPVDNSGFGEHGNFDVVYIGHVYAKMNGIANFILAMKDFPQVHLHIYGYSSQGTIEQLKRLAAGANVESRIHWYSPVPADQVLQTIKRYDAGLIVYHYVDRPISFKTYSTTKLYVYLHAGLPVICSDSQTYKSDFQSHDVMYWIQWDDIDSIKKALNSCLHESAEFLRARKKRCMMASEPLVWENYEHALSDVYGNL